MVSSSSPETPGATSDTGFVRRRMIFWNLETGS